jgi:hypothetical protein
VVWLQWLAYPENKKESLKSVKNCLRTEQETDSKLVTKADQGNWFFISNSHCSQAVLHQFWWFLLFFWIHNFRYLITNAIYDLQKAQLCNHSNTSYCWKYKWKYVGELTKLKDILGYEVYKVVLTRSHSLRVCWAPTKHDNILSHLSWESANNYTVNNYNSYISTWNYSRMIKLHYEYKWLLLQSRNKNRKERFEFITDVNKLCPTLVLTC